MPPEKAGATGEGWVGGGKPLYRAGHADKGFQHHECRRASHYFGSSNSGELQDGGFEIPNPDLATCVELIADRELLEEFYRTSG